MDSNPKAEFGGPDRLYFMPAFGPVGRTEDTVVMLDPQGIRWGAELKQAMRVLGDRGYRDGQQPQSRIWRAGSPLLHASFRPRRSNGRHRCDAGPTGHSVGSGIEAGNAGPRRSGVSGWTATPKPNLAGRIAFTSCQLSAPSVERKTPL